MGPWGAALRRREVDGPTFITRALTPSIMEMVGRSLIRIGEVVFLIGHHGRGAEVATD